MSEKNNGGPAFPCAYNGSTVPDAAGMTLRDYFAAKAMQACSSCPEWRDKSDMAQTARAAYRMADEMLAARETT